MLLCLSLLLAIDTCLTFYHCDCMIFIMIIHYNDVEAFRVNMRDCVMVIYADNIIIYLLLNFIRVFSYMLVILALHNSFHEALSVT